MTPSFLKALGVAFFLHFAGWFLFQVTPLKIQTGTVFPFTEVQLDRQAQEQIALAEPLDESSLLCPISEPVLDEPNWDPSGYPVSGFRPEIFYENLERRKYVFEGFKITYD